MRTTRRRLLATVPAALLALGTSRARGNEDAAKLPALRDSMARFAQPVRVGDLPRRYLLAPSEAQTVLGRVAPDAILRTPDAHLLLAVDRGGILGLGATRVAVPLDAVALLGEHVVLIGLAPAELAALPPLAPEHYSAIAPDTEIRMAIVGPFH